MLSENGKRALRACFAILRKLLPQDSVTEDKFWEWVRDWSGEESRRNMSEYQLIWLEARLRAAENDKAVRNSILAEVRKATAQEVQGADKHGTGDPSLVRLFQVVDKTPVRRGGWTSDCPVYELVNQVESPSDDFIVKCEDYADIKGVELLIVYPNGNTRTVRSVGFAHRKSLRDNPPTFTETWCKRCSTTPADCTCGRFG